MEEQIDVSDDEDMETIEGEPTPTVSKIENVFSHILTKLVHTQVSNSDTTGDIVTTEALRARGLVFNTKYKLLICELCQEGLPLCNVHSHLRLEKSERANWNQKKDHHSLSTVLFENHHHEIKDSKPQIKRIICESLISAGYIKKHEDIRGFQKDSWDPEPIASGRNISPVAGLRFLPKCYQCTVLVDGKVCDFISPMPGSLGVHQSKIHKKKQSHERKRVTAQTLTEAGPWFIQYFAVSEQVSQPSSTASANLSELDLDAARGLLRRSTAQYTVNLDIIGDLNVKTTLPVFIVTGIDKFLNPLHRASLKQKYGPDPEDARYIALRIMVLESFKDAMNMLDERYLPARLLLTMTNCTP